MQARAGSRVQNHREDVGKAALIAATATAAHDAIFLALCNVGGRDLLLGFVGSIGRLRRRLILSLSLSMSLSLRLRLSLLLLPQLALAPGLVLLDVGLRELDDGSGTTEHLWCTLDSCLQQRREVIYCTNELVSKESVVVIGWSAQSNSGTDGRWVVRS